MPTLYTAQTKAELERVLGIMKPYIDECVCYDVVYSPKFGYLLIDLPGHDTIDDAEVVPLDDAATLLHKLFIKFSYFCHVKREHGMRSPGQSRGAESQSLNKLPVNCLLISYSRLWSGPLNTATKLWVKSSMLGIPILLHLI